MIIGVAVKAGDLMIALPRPNRHADCIRMIQQLGLRPDIEAEWSKPANQGFYDSVGRFFTRPEAAQAAYMWGQIGHKLGAICSEDLW